MYFLRRSTTVRSASLFFFRLPFPFSLKISAGLCAKSLTKSVIDKRPRFTAVRSKGAVVSKPGIPTLTFQADVTFFSVHVCGAWSEAMMSIAPLPIPFHGGRPDEHSIKLAEYDGVPLIYSGLPSVEQLVKSLRRLYRIALRVKLGRRVRPPPKISA